MRSPVLRLLGCPMVPGAHSGNSPWSMPLAGLSVALSRQATWVGSEIFPGCGQRQRQVLRAPSSPHPLPRPRCCESVRLLQGGAGELPFPSWLFRAARNSGAALEGHQGAGGAERKNNPPFMGIALTFIEQPAAAKTDLREWRQI